MAVDRLDASDAGTCCERVNLINGESIDVEAY